MSQDFVPDSMPASPALSWSEAWLRALVQPSVGTFERIANNPNASPTKAYLWTFISAFIGFGFSFALSLVLIIPVILGSFGTPEFGTALPVLLLALVCGIPLSAALSVLGLVITAGITQVIAGFLGGTGTYAKLVYTLAAYLAPLSLISLVVGAIPLVNCLLFLLVIYALALNVIAVKAVNQFDWGKAIASSLPVLLVITLALVVVASIFFALVRPAMENAF